MTCRAWTTFLALAGSSWLGACSPGDEQARDNRGIGDQAGPGGSTSTPDGHGAPEVGTPARGLSEGDGTGCAADEALDACGHCGGDGTSCGCTEGWCAELVFEHNEIRRQLNLGSYLDQPRAEPPLAMVGWDPVIAARAQEHADSLSHWDEGHSTEAFREYQSTHHDGYHGENMAIGTETFAEPAHVVGQSWSANEAVDCVLQTCGGHYTQIAWRESEWIGCGSRDDLPFASSSGTVIVCQYAPGGNVNQRAPY